MLQNTLNLLLKQDHAQLIFQDHTFSSRVLVERAKQILQILTEMQCESQHIAFCLPNSPELLCWQLACFHLGTPIIPIIYEHTANDIQQILRLTNAKYLLTTSEKQLGLKKLTLAISCQIKIVDDTQDALLAIDEQTI